MSDSRRTISIVALALAGLMLVSGMAVAAVEVEPDSDDSADTLFSHAYDPDSQLLLVSSTATDTAYDCSLPSGSTMTAYRPFENGLGIVEGITVDGIPVKFLARSATEDALAYDGDPGNPCTVDALVVAGPQGQVNHGQVVRAFSHYLEGGNKGCLMRWIARSSYGKDDQQVRTEDVEPTFAPNDSGEVEFTNVLTTCNGGNGHAAAAAGQGRGRDGAPGKSGAAPGRNK